jgi:hypothetical protein
VKLTSLIFPAVNFFIWGFMAFIGFDGERSVEARMGGVSLAQFQFYVVFPLIMLSIAVIPAAILSQTKWSMVGNIWSGMTLLVLVPYLFFYGGGI